MLRATLLAALLLVLLPVLLAPRRRRRVAQTQLQLVASSLWTLDHLCLSMGSVLREWPELKRIRVDLTALPELDEASVASVKRAIAATAVAGVELLFDGCDLRMASFLASRGVDGRHLGPCREPRGRPAETLH